MLLAQSQRWVVWGRQHKANRGVGTWGWQNVLAFACQSCVVLLLPRPLRPLQTLDEHHSPVTALEWKPEAPLSQLGQRPHLVLASGDSTGNIILWNVLEATITRTLRVEQDHTSGAVLCFHWHPDNTSLLYSLHAPASLVLWDTQTGVRLWKKDFPEPIATLTFNPFNTDDVYIISQRGSIYMTNLENMWSGSSLSAAPVFALQCGVGNILSGGTTTNNHGATSNGKAQQQKTDVTAPRDPILQASFCPWNRHLLFLLLPKQIVIFDVDAKQAVGFVTNNKYSPFRQMLLSPSLPNHIFCLHVDGLLSTWATDDRTSYSLDYELVQTSEAMQQGKLPGANNAQRGKNKGRLVNAIAMSPYNTSFAAITSDGTIWMWDYSVHQEDKQQALKLVDEQRIGTVGISGFCQSLSSPVCAVAVCPFSPYQRQSRVAAAPLLAVGTYGGGLQIIDTLHMRLCGEYSITTGNPIPVRGIQWLDSSSVLCYTCEEKSSKSAKPEFHNRVIRVDLRTGRQKDIRKIPAEATYIRGICVSVLRHYLVVMLKDRPFELWDVRSWTMVGLVKPPSSQQQITALVWRPHYFISSASIEDVAEQFVFSTSDGMLYCYTVQQNTIVPTQLQAELNTGIISTLAWQDNILVGGDTNGVIHCWNSELKRTQNFPTQRGLIRNIAFSPDTSAEPAVESQPRKRHHILVLFNEGEFGVWDLDHGHRLSFSNYLLSRDLRALDVDWVSPTHPVVATSDGCVRILDRSLSTSNSPICKSIVFQPSIATPLLLSGLQAAQLYTLLLHLLPVDPTKQQYCFPWSKHPAAQRFPRPFLLRRGSVTSSTSSQRSSPSSSGTMDDENAFALLRFVPKDVTHTLTHYEDIPSRCLTLAAYFGNQRAVRFWTLASRAIKRLVQKTRPDDTAHPSKHIPEEQQIAKTPEGRDDDGERSSLPEEDAVGVISHTSRSTINSRRSSAMDIIDAGSEGFPLQLPEVLQDSSYVRALEQQRASHNEALCNSYDLVQSNTNLKLFLGQKEAAMEQLLATSFSHPNYRTDLLKACIVAATHSHEAFLRTTQEVAVNMVANGWIDDGVQLLCIINKGLEATRYLQNHSRWLDAAWLAKMMLNKEECTIVYKRWANHLINSNRKDKALEVLLSLGEIRGVLYLLHSTGRLDTAVMFAAACLQAGLLEPYLAHGTLQHGVPYWPSLTF
ncbi:WD repeat-containing protein 11, variant 2 [Balamuthia mandrillaris]